MIEISQSAAVLAGAIAALLLCAGTWMLFVGLRARAEARIEDDANARAAALVASSPAQAMLVRADGRAEMPQGLADWLGLAEPARDIEGLVAEEGGLEPEDAAALASHVTAAQRGGQPFNLAVRTHGSQRALLVVGERAPEAMRAPGGALLWFLDTTESEGEIYRLQRENVRLRAAFDALTAVIEAAPMPMWYRGADLRLLMVNTAYVRAVEGKDSEDVVARGIELVEGAGISGPLANAAIARDTGEAQNAAMPATIGGERRMLRLHDVPLPTGGVAGFAVDVEELEQLRGGMKRFGAAQRAMLDRLSAGVVQFAPDRTLSFSNQPFRRLFGIKGEWLADRPEFDRVLDRMREANRLPEVRDFPAWKAERREWFTAPEAVEETWSMAGGTHLRVVAQPLPEGGLMLIVEDRTQQFELQREHGEMQQVRTATLESLAEAVAVFGKGRLQLWNRKYRQVWGFDETFLDSHPQLANLVKAAAPRLSNPNRADVLGDLVRLAAKDRQTRGSTLAFADGRHFDITAVPLPDGNALMTMLDTTDHHRAEQALRDRNDALEAADRVKTAFVANMSYELRTPLTSIKGFAEMLHSGFAGPLSESGTEYSEAILTSVERLGNLIDDVLDLTQDGAALERAPVDLELAAANAAEAISPLARAKRIELVVDDAGSGGSVTGDPRRLRQVIEHLLRHAVAGTPEGGRVLLHLDGNDKVARVIVSDDGPGMSPEQVSRAFDRFARGGRSRSGQRALGLGLPLAKQFVEAHGGRIQLLSEPGEGTLVTVELPR